jgi:hypothetical protein
MWHGVKEYVAIAAIVALILHALTRRYRAASLGGAVICSIGNIVGEAWQVSFEVNPGWAPFMFIAGLVLALPVCLVVGLPFLYWRQHPRLRCKGKPGEEKQWRS